MLGIQDPMIWSAYLLCVLATAYCVIHGLIYWNRDDEHIHPEDLKWAEDERQVEEDL